MDRWVVVNYRLYDILLITLPPVPINHPTPVSCQSFLTAAQQLLSSKPVINQPLPILYHNCYHQSLPSIMTCHQLSTLAPRITTAVTIKDYNQSSHHPQHTCPQAIMQQLSWWLMLISAQSHRPWLMLMSAFFLLNTAVCWHSILS